MGTARGRTQGSWRPLAANATTSPAVLTGLLFRRDGGGRLERRPAGDGGTGRDSTLDSARPVAAQERPTGSGHKLVVVGKPCHSSTGEPTADFETLAGRE